MEFERKATSRRQDEGKNGLEDREFFQVLENLGKCLSKPSQESIAICTPESSQYQSDVCVCCQTKHSSTVSAFIKTKHNHSFDDFSEVLTINNSLFLTNLLNFYE